MRNRIKSVAVMLVATLMLTGCTMRTVGQMYQLPKRSEDYSNLQSVMDKAMGGLKFSAPISGDNQQSVQMADIDGDGEQEYLVFCKGSAELPLRILVFDRVDGTLPILILLRAMVPISIRLNTSKWTINRVLKWL